MATESVCPRCKGKLFFAGKAFRAPRRSDLKGWRKVALLLQSGFVFYPDAFAFNPPKNPNALPDWEQRIRELAKSRKRERKIVDWERKRKDKIKAAKWRANEKAARNETD